MLVQMMCNAERQGLISGLKVARTAPAISNLLYADDSMFYCKGSEEKLEHLSQILARYSIASGINYLKSSISFGKNMP